MFAAASARIPRSIRPVFRAFAWRGLLRRQLAWLLTTLAVATILPMVIDFPNRVLWMALAVGLGAAAAIADRWLKGLFLASCTVILALAWHWIWAGGQTMLNGTTMLLIGAISGAGVARWSGPFTDMGSTVLGAMVGATSTGTGFAAMTTYVPQDWSFTTMAFTAFGILGLCSSASVWVGGIDWRCADRMPCHMHIRRYLREPFLSRVLKAWTRDRALARKVKDLDTRDGLGEVAAWIYRLSFSLQEIDTAIGGIDTAEIQARIDHLETEASRAEDLFTRDRTRAAASHLKQLVQHRCSLAVERERLSALLLYAEAFLEEAEAGIVVALVHPGEQIPDRLTDVLSRLRDDAAAGDSRRRTTRELVALS